MINREHIESILKINGVVPGSPDEEIRSVLMSARYSKDEVDTAIMVLRENIKTKTTRVEGLHKIFRTDEALRPDEISQLLGIEVDIDQSIKIRSHSNDLSGLHYMVVWVLSVVLAVSGILLYMYLHRMGVFHPSAGFSFPINEIPTATN